MIYPSAPHASTLFHHGGFLGVFRAFKNTVILYSQVSRKLAVLADTAKDDAFCAYRGSTTFRHRRHLLYGHLLQQHAGWAQCLAVENFLVNFCIDDRIALHPS